MPDKKISFAINVNSMEKISVFATVHERKNGDLIIWPSPSTYNRTLGTTETSTKIKHQKYSVHRSQASTTGINAIKFSMISEDEEISYSQHTTSIKSPKGFAVVYTKICPSLNDTKYNPSDESKLIKIGTIEEKNFTLVYSILVGSRKEKLTLPKKASFKYIEHLTEHFKIVLVWSFIPLAAHNTGMILNGITYPIEDDKEYLGPTSGMNRLQLHEFLKMQRQICAEQMCETLAKEGFNQSALIRHIELYGYLTTATAGNSEWNKNIERMHQNGTLQFASESFRHIRST